MCAHQTAWDAESSVPSRREVCGLVKRRGWSVGGGFTCTLGVKGRTMGESPWPGGESILPCGEAEKIVEVFCEWLRS